MKRNSFYWLLIGLLGANVLGFSAELASEVSQYGITWKFDRPYPVGQFINGDWWVIGPVTVTDVNPAPSCGEKDDPNGAKTRYGASYSQTDDRMRNGSMVAQRPDEGQGFDSRLKNYKSELSVTFPRVLNPDESLLSTIANNPANVTVMMADMMPVISEKTGERMLKTGAVLTCLDNEPPGDAFRPAYAGSIKTVYRVEDIHWESLPNLKSPENVPSWAQFERYLQRPWFDHVDSWMHTYMGPSENQANYGRDFARITGMATLMLMLDVPREQKETLTVEMIQLGIDLYGLAKCGRQWSANGAHFSGRKWPILFAGIMLADEDMKNLSADTLFAEDQQTYYGQGWNGQTALFQIVLHTGAKPPYEEKQPDTWGAMEKQQEGYRRVNSLAWVATSLAVQLMQARSLWNHDAFFDYVDRYMSELGNPHPDGKKGMTLPAGAGTLDPFADEMWRLYRGAVPEQPSGKENLKWVWSGSSGTYRQNSKPE